MTSLAQELRFALRRQRRQPAFTLTVVLTLALGIGFATAVLTVANALLLRELPLRQPRQLVVLSGAPGENAGGAMPLGVVSVDGFAAGTRTLSQVAMLNYEGAAPVTVVEEGRVTRLRRSLVSGNYFDVLGATPVLGRALRPEDDAPGAPPVVVLSHRAWFAYFGGAADVVGKRLATREDGLVSTVVGVMPAGVDYPRGADLWIPVRLVVSPASMPMLAFDMIGRLNPSTSIDAARAELTAFLHRADATPAERRMQGRAVSLTETILGNTRPAVIAFVAASGLLLLLTCLNVANLLLLRGTARVSELAVRLALGATRARVVRETLAEQALLALYGGVVGAAFAVAAIRAFVAFAPASLPRLDEVRIDPLILLVALALASLATIVSALAPAMWAIRTDARLAIGGATLAGLLRTRGARRAPSAREILVGVQVALAMVILSAAALLGRSVWNLQRAELAYDDRQVAVGELAFPPGRYDAPEAQAALHRGLRERIAGVQGVRGIAPIVSVPFSEHTGWMGKAIPEGRTDVDALPTVDLEVIGSTFFETIGLPLSRGRAFTEEDGPSTDRVVVLSESAAAQYWPGADPIGRRVRMGPRSAPFTLTVVGVVPDARYRDIRAPRATIYFPLTQSFFPFGPATLVVRSERSTSDLTAAIRAALAEFAPDVALVRVAPFAEFMSRPLAQPRMNAALLGVFAFAATVLALVGLFGTVATIVRLRTRELGIRMALGATTTDVRSLVVGRNVAVVATGIMLGVAGALSVNSLLESLLYGVDPVDRLTISAVALLLLGAATLAAYLSARSVSRIHPASALRAE